MKRTVGYCIYGVIAILFSQPVLAESKVVTFKSLLPSVYVLTHYGKGDCRTKTENKLLHLTKNATASVPSEGADVCYVYSYLKTPNSSPLGGGIAHPGELVELRQPKDLPNIAVNWPTNSALVTSEVLRGVQGGTPESKGGLPNGEPPVHPSPVRPVPAVPLRPAGQPPASSGPNIVSEERPLIQWIDPLTPPQSKTDCVKEAWGDIPFDGQWRTCVGWRTQWRCMRRQAVLVLRVRGITFQALHDATSQCLSTAAVVGAISGLATGGSSAVATFQQTFAICLTARITGQLVGISVDNRGGWTDWGGC